MMTNCKIERWNNISNIQGCMLFLGNKYARRSPRWNLYCKLRATNCKWDSTPRNQTYTCCCVFIWFFDPIIICTGTFFNPPKSNDRFVLSIRLLLIYWEVEYAELYNCMVISTLHTCIIVGCDKALLFAMVSANQITYKCFSIL